MFINRKIGCYRVKIYIRPRDPNKYINRFLCFSPRIIGICKMLSFGLAFPIVDLGPNFAIMNR